MKTMRKYKESQAKANAQREQQGALVKCPRCLRNYRQFDVRNCIATDQGCYFNLDNVLQRFAEKEANKEGII